MKINVKSCGECPASQEEGGEDFCALTENIIEFTWNYKNGTDNFSIGVPPDCPLLSEPVTLSLADGVKAWE